MSMPPKKARRRRFLFPLVFVLIATTVTLALGELVIRLIAHQRLIYNIEMVKYAKALKIRDPAGEVSHVHRPSSQAHLMGVDVSLNSLGDRGPELKNPKPQNTRRILVLGSSITMGWGVPYENVFTSVAARMLETNQPFGRDTSFEVINAGIGNYNTYFQSRLFQRQYPIVKPDMVVLHYFISDVQARGVGRDNFILKHSYLAAFFFDRWSKMKLRFGGHYEDLFTFYKNLYVDDSSLWKETQRHISEMRATAARDGVPFLVMIIPDIHDLSPGTPYRDLYAKMETAFRAMNISTVNTFDAFQHDFGDDVSKLWIQGDDPHPNARGHALMGETLYRHLVETDPLRLKTVPANPR